jgi:FkbH-like protein
MGTSAGNLIRPERPVLSASKQALLRKRVQGAFTALNQGPQIAARGETGPAPLSFAQQRLWFLQQLEPESAAYNVVSALRLTGPLDLRAFQKAIEKVHERHAVVRAAFPAPDGTPVQTVSASTEVACEIVDLQHVPAGEREGVAAAALRERAHRPFDLIKGPVSRYAVVRCAADQHIFLMVTHHIVTDGWSVTLFFRELEAFYESLTRTVPAQLPDLPIQYSDFSWWQHESLRSNGLQTQLTYWKSKLAGAPAAIDLPTDRERSGEGGVGGWRTMQLPEPLCRALASESRVHGATEFIMLAAALAVTLNRWTGQTDLVLGTVAAGRTRREIENLIGCFMNFLPLRVQISPDCTASEVIASTRSTVLEAYANQDCPFDQIVTAINPARGVHRNPLYNVALLLQNFPAGALSSDILSAEFMPVDNGASLLDLRFIVEQNARGLSVLCEYDTAVFDPSTIETLLGGFQATLATLVEAPQTRVSQIGLPTALEIQAKTARGRCQIQTIAVAATFTADPLQDPVLYWLHEWEVAAKVTFAPYNQIFQQLLDPSSVLNQNRSGLNVLLVRLQDWFAVEQSSDAPSAQTIHEFLSALKASASRTAVPWLVCLCPDAARPAAGLSAYESAVISELREVSGVYVLTPAEIQRWYPVEQVFDTAADRLGNVPYTPLFFAALGTAIVRKFHALKRPPRKVIALDCDNTLWEGVCGEDGPRGIRLDGPRQALQEFMRRQAESGMLLCLCTKNNDADVDEVFRCRSDFPLRRDSFIGARINWKSKSENLKSLARELNVGLDSFIFVDDNPMECAEVEANCPGVVALLLPESAAQIPAFLEHAWIFDHLRVTDEDKKRARLYDENRRREELRAQCVSMAEFLAGLDLHIEIEEPRGEQIARISQLTQRTNQFNFTTQRYSEADIQRWLGEAPATKVFAVSVRDRFGDYGLVGVMMARLASDSVDVDTFLLSCRVLGKGVEHRMLARLGELAQAQDLSRVNLAFRASAKNRPARDFLEKYAAAFRQPSRDGSIFTLPARFAAGVRYEPEEIDEVAPGGNGGGQAAGPAAEPPAPFTKCRTIALHSHDVQWVLQSVEAWARGNRAVVSSSAPYAAPRTDTERELCRIWGELLGVERVGIHDDFFALGGSSLLAVRLFVQIEKALGKTLPLVVLFQSPTIEKLAHAIEQRKEHGSATAIVPIQTAGSKPPLILIHGAGGGILWGYANLASHLGQDQPVFAIEPRLAAAGHTSLTVEEMAEQYLADLRAFQPTGPYYLGGYCFGGYVAYEMARLLTQAREAVGLLALIDSAAPNGSYDRVPWWRPTFYFRFLRNTPYLIQDFLRMDRPERRRFLARKLGVVKRKIFRRGQRKERMVDIQEYIDPVNFPDEELRLWQVHLNAGGLYKPKPYEGCVTLLRTRGQPALCSFDGDYGWGELAMGGVDVRIVPGWHEGIFVEPDVRSLAAQMAACLRQARTEAGGK